MIFSDGTDIYFARQLVNERLQEARRRDLRRGRGGVGFCLGGVFNLDDAEGFFLVRPDDEPDIESHDKAEIHAGADGAGGWACLQRHCFMHVAVQSCYDKTGDDC